MRFNIIFMAFCIVCLAGPAWGEQKIGVVNIDAIISKSEPGQTAKGKLEKQFESMKKDMDKQKEEIQSLREEMQKQSLVLSQDAKQDKELEFKRKIRDYQDATQVYSRKLKTEEQALLEPIFATVVEVINEYGEKHDYTFIMDSTNSGLVYAKEDTDLTNKVLVELNRAWREKQKAGTVE